MTCPVHDPCRICASQMRLGDPRQVVSSAEYVERQVKVEVSSNGVLSVKQTALLASRRYQQILRDVDELFERAVTST